VRSSEGKGERREQVKGEGETHRDAFEYVPIVGYLNRNADPNFSFFWQTLKLERFR
jgi:hypothetical protein